MTIYDEILDAATVFPPGRVRGPSALPPEPPPPPLTDYGRVYLSRIQTPIWAQMRLACRHGSATNETYRVDPPNDLAQLQASCRDNHDRLIGCPCADYVDGETASAYSTTQAVNAIVDGATQVLVSNAPTLQGTVFGFLDGKITVLTDTKLQVVAAVALPPGSSGPGIVHVWINGASASQAPLVDESPDNTIGSVDWIGHLLTNATIELAYTNTSGKNENVKAGTLVCSIAVKA